MATTDIDLFKTQLPAHVTNAKSKTMKSMGDGLAGGFGNRLSIRNSKFRFNVNGTEVGQPTTDPLEVVIFAVAAAIQRMYYAGAYVPGSKEPPTCFSLDGKVPSDESTTVQNSICATCPQNVKGSGRQPGTKACAYKKRVVVLSPYDLEGAMYALDVNGMTLFGEQDPSKNLYSFKGYYEKLVAHNMDIAAIVTKLSFDDAASVPKLHFTPVRALTPEEFAQVEVRMEDDEVARILADMGNGEEGTVAPAAPAKAIAAPAAAPAPVAQTAPKGVGGLIQDEAPPVKKGGFPSKTATPEPVAQASAPQVTPKQPVKPIEVDLDSLVTFDDATT